MISWNKNYQLNPRISGWTTLVFFLYTTKYTHICHQLKINGLWFGVYIYRAILLQLTTPIAIDLPPAKSCRPILFYIYLYSSTHGVEELLSWHRSRSSRSFHRPALPPLALAQGADAALSNHHRHKPRRATPVGSLHDEGTFSNCN